MSLDCHIYCSDVHIYMGPRLTEVKVWMRSTWWELQPSIIMNIRTMLIIMLINKRVGTVCALYILWTKLTTGKTGQIFLKIVNLRQSRGRNLLANLMDWKCCETSYERKSKGCWMVIVHLCENWEKEQRNEKQVKQSGFR